jgi:DNA-binding response OmpR family regulator
MKKILLVDDEEGIQMLYREELEDDGYDVISAYTGEEGLEKFKEESPDLVILDIQMPGMNGIETLRQMKMANSKLPVILSSAYNEYKQDLGAWASDAYVVKSSDINDLKEAVRSLLLAADSEKGNK